ncbi:arylesterase [Parapusillimonas sp. SGNA-6]|nr:arylesterase [Parapusillimonas sp. SGNA-6]
MVIRWRSIVAAVCCLHLSVLPARASTPAQTAPKTVLVVGDSLSAEYGLQRDSGWVALVAQRLQANNAGYQIQNASISGDTTSGGVSRLPDALARFSPAIVIIELGSNDALRGLDLAMTEANLSTMVTSAQQAGSRVLLIGMQIPPNYGRRYAERFRDLFGQVAERHGASLVPFLLEGVATDKAMFQDDGIHPNEQAQRHLAENVWRHLEPMLQGPAPDHAGR